MRVAHMWSHVDLCKRVYNPLYPLLSSVHFDVLNVIFVYLAALYTVMCYNVLCDKYATRQLYGYCPSWALNWEYRKKGIIEEIRHYSADIISLQVHTYLIFKHKLQC